MKCSRSSRPASDSVSSPRAGSLRAGRSLVILQPATYPSARRRGMIPHRPLALGIGLIGVIGLSAVLGQTGSASRPDGPLDPSMIAVRLRLGIGDREGQAWGGRVSVDMGEVLGVEGWRVRQGDRVTGTDSWETRTRQLPGNAKKAAKKADSHAAGNASAAKAQPGFAPGGVVVLLKAPEGATLSVETARGNFKVPLANLSTGSPRRFLDGKADAQRVPATASLVREENPQDFPAAVVDSSGDTWVAYVDHQPRGKPTLDPIRDRPKSFNDLVPREGGDQVRLVRFSRGRADRPMDVTDAGLDVWRPAVAVAGDGTVVVAWSELQGGNWDIHSRSYDPSRKSWSSRKPLTTGRSTDSDVALATASNGQVWMAWQAWSDGQSDIMLAPVNGQSEPTKIANSSANEWSPALVADKSGRLHVAYDTYEAGNYDVFLRTRSADGTLGSATAIANSASFEARPSLAVDPRGRVWVAYEERPENWGKDSGAHDKGGPTLYRGSRVRVRCADGDRALEVPAP